MDDSIAEKPYTDENDIVCWHSDHTQGRSVKGINFLTRLYHCAGVSLPVGVTLIAKTEHYVDPKDGKDKRRSPVGQNEYYRQTPHHPPPARRCQKAVGRWVRVLTRAVANQIVFAYVLNDVWFASAENMRLVKHDLHKDFVMPVKTNRKVALNLADQQQGRYARVDTLALEANTAREVYLEGVHFPLLLVKQVFVNGDGSTGVLYLVTSDTTLTADQVMALYRTRWNVEPYHKSLKQNASLEKSPTQTLTTQTNHFFAAVCGYIKLELLKRSTKLNHFALKSKLYLAALHVAFDTLRQLQPVRLAA